MTAERKNASQKCKTLNDDAFSADGTITDHRDAVRENAGDRDSSHLTERAAVRILDDRFGARVRDVERLRFWWRAWRVAFFVAVAHVIVTCAVYGARGAWTILIAIACLALRRWYGHEVLTALDDRHEAAMQLQAAEITLARAVKASGVFRRSGQ